MTDDPLSTVPDTFEGAVDQQLDAKGLLCPEPVMLLHNTLRPMASGQVLHMVATDPSSRRDVTRFCDFLGHELLAAGENPSADGGVQFGYWVRKK